MKKKMTSAWRDKSRSKASNPKDADLLSTRSQFGPTVEQLILKKKWDEIIELLKPRLRQHRNEYWVHLQLATAYFEKFDNDIWMDHMDKAYELNRKSKFTAWLFARSAFRCKMYDTVIVICHEIVEFGAANILLDPHCKNLAAAESLIMDCHYLLAAAYKLEKKHDLAKAEMDTFKEGLRSGIKSIYRKKVPAYARRSDYAETASDYAKASSDRSSDTVRRAKPNDPPSRDATAGKAK